MSGCWIALRCGSGAGDYPVALRVVAPPRRALLRTSAAWLQPQSRSDQRQTVYRLLCNRQGQLLVVEVLAGDTAAPATQDAGRQLKQRFGLKHVVLVGDRRMVASARIRDELRRAGLD